MVRPSRSCGQNKKSDQYSSSFIQNPRLTNGRIGAHSIQDNKKRRQAKLNLVVHAIAGTFGISSLVEGDESKSSSALRGWWLGKIHLLDGAEGTKLLFNISLGCLKSKRIHSRGIGQNQTNQTSAEEKENQN
jgi:hypothetical protein